MKRRTDAALLTEMSIHIDDMEDFISEHPEARQNMKENPNGVFLANRVKAVAVSASHLSPKARLGLPQQTMRWMSETAEITDRYDRWHTIDQNGYRNFISTGLRLCRESVDKSLAEIPQS